MKTILINPPKTTGSWPAAAVYVPNQTDCTYFLGCLLDSADLLCMVSTPQKAPEEVVADGYEGATSINMCRMV